MQSTGIALICRFAQHFFSVSTDVSYTLRSRPSLQNRVLWSLREGGRREARDAERQPHLLLAAPQRLENWSSSARWSCLVTGWSAAATTLLTALTASAKQQQHEQRWISFDRLSAEHRPRTQRSSLPLTLTSLFRVPFERHKHKRVTTCSPDRFPDRASLAALRGKYRVESKAWYVETQQHEDTSYCCATQISES